MQQGILDAIIYGIDEKFQGMGKTLQYLEKEVFTDKQSWKKSIKPIFWQLLDLYQLDDKKSDITEAGLALMFDCVYYGYNLIEGVEDLFHGNFVQGAANIILPLFLRTIPTHAIRKEKEKVQLEEKLSKSSNV